MADPESPELLFKRALAQYLHDQGHGVYKPVGSYLATERGIYTSGPKLPTSGDNCIVLTSLHPVREGRADIIYRIQILTRVKGSNVDAGNAAAAIAGSLDHKENILPGMNVSWVWSFSRLEFDADTNGRSAVAETFYFRTRR